MGGPLATHPVNRVSGALAELPFADDSTQMQAETSRPPEPSGLGEHRQAAEEEHYSQTDAKHSRGRLDGQV